MEQIRTDVAVIGLGAMGASTLFQLARRGVDAVGLDRFVPPHALGSSHGETRITRCAVGEGDAYVPLVTRSHAIWRMLEAETGEPLLEACGVLVVSPGGGRTEHHGKPDFLNRTVGVARRHGIVHEQLDAAGVAARFPAFALHGDDEAYFEPGGGYVRPERCIAVQIAQATALGARVVTGCEVQAMEQQGATVVLRTEDRTVVADQVVVAAGPWAGKLLGAPFTGTLVPYRQVLHWFPVADEAAYRPGAFPSFIWMHGPRPGDYFYGFPALPGSGEVKVASEQYGVACDPDRVDRTVAAAEGPAMFSAHVAGRLPGLNAEGGRSAACLYTVTPDSGFVIDRHPDCERIIVVAACSGHGFKHSAGVGEAVAELASEGRSTVDLGPFRLARLHADRPA